MRDLEKFQPGLKIHECCTRTGTSAFVAHLRLQNRTLVDSVRELCRAQPIIFSGAVRIGHGFIAIGVVLDVPTGQVIIPPLWAPENDRQCSLTRFGYHTEDGAPLATGQRLTGRPQSKQPLYTIREHST